MNLPWNDSLTHNATKNLELLNRRFPDLAKEIGLTDLESLKRVIADADDRLSVATAQSGDPTLSYQGQCIHSKYDPKREAERTIADSTLFPSEGCVFSGIGLAWHAEQYALLNPRGAVALVESNTDILALALACRPLDHLLSHPSLMIVVSVTPEIAHDLLETAGFADFVIFSQPSLQKANAEWYSRFTAIARRKTEKTRINSNTLRKFGSLWLSNMGKNLGEMRSRSGIDSFKGLFPGIPAVLLAAGPSLDSILPHLGELSKRCVVICVDTALRACTRMGIQPDFIVLVDPQYWNWRHLDGQSCPDSFLITEGAAWPAVFRFPCRAICLCSSLFPLGKYLEQKTRVKGELGAGGSVSTTAWDFARFLGVSEVFAAGLDLSFPDKQTHFSGSIFEERTHCTSTRISPAETAGYRALTSAKPYFARNYEGKDVLTDKRLNLYAWWFENRLAQEGSPKTSTITPQGLHIAGIGVSSIPAILNQVPVQRDEIQSRIEKVHQQIRLQENDPEQLAVFDTAITNLENDLKDLESLAKRGIDRCKRGQYDRLDEINEAISRHSAKDIVSMTFTHQSTGNISADSMNLYVSLLEATRQNLRATKKKW